MSHNLSDTGLDLCVSSAAVLLSRLEKYNPALCSKQTLYLTEYIYTSEEIVLTVWCQTERT